MAGMKRAVIVGINKYDDPEIDELSGAENDATEVRGILTRAGQFAIDDQHFLTKNATCQRIRTALSDLFWNSEEACDVALFYFSGHGVRDHLGHGYLLPRDASHAAPFVNGIGIQELKQLFFAAKPKTSCVLLLDCCYSGIATGTEKGGADSAELMKNFVEGLTLPSSEDLDNEAEGRFIFAAAGAETAAREQICPHLGGEAHAHGVFSFHLIEALRSGLEGAFGQTSLGALRTHLSRVLPRDHKPHFSSNNEVGADNIILATAEEIMLEEIKRQVIKIENFLKDQRPGEVITAIRLLSELDKLGRNLDEIAPFFPRIDDFLRARQDEVHDWWYDNWDRILAEIGTNDCYDRLKEAVLNIDRPTVSALPRDIKYLVSRVMEEVEKDKIALSNKGYLQIAKELRRMEKKTSQPARQAASTSPPTAESRSQPPAPSGEGRY